MTAAILLSDLAHAGICVTYRGDKLHVAAARGKITSELKARLLREKPALLAALRETRTRPVVKFRLSDTSGWATAVGRPGESVALLIDDLRQRWARVEIAARRRRNDPSPSSGPSTPLR